MDARPAFLLDLVEQHWCEPEPAKDPSQAGRLRVMINGITIVDGGRDDLGVARTALALSRTLLRNHTAEDPVAEQLVLHDCGFATTLGSCGIGANWWVRHVGPTVRIDGVVRFDSTYGVDDLGAFATEDPVEMARYSLSKPHDGIAFPDAACAIPIEVYGEQVARLAHSVLDFAAPANKQFVDDFDRSEWLGWQAEIRDNLTTYWSRPG